MAYGLNIKLARESRALSQKDLAKIAGISQVSLSRMENAELAIPYSLIERLSEALHYPESFFEKKFEDAENQNSMFYRKRATMRVRDLDVIKRKIQVRNMVIDTLLDVVEIPELSIPAIECTDEYHADEIAYRLRRHLNLPSAPVLKITSILEKCGVIVQFIELGDAGEKFDGLTTFTPRGYPVIYINSGMPNDRKRFNLAHEAGHLAMHLRSENLDKSEDEKEKEANMFAGEFLLPRSECISELSNMRMRDLPNLKKKWLVSKASIIHRAHELGCIDENTGRYFYITLGKNNERKCENGIVPIDRPVILSKMIRIHLDELGYTLDELSKILGICEDELKELYSVKSVLTL